MKQKARFKVWPLHRSGVNLIDEETPRAAILRDAESACENCGGGIFLVADDIAPMIESILPHTPCWLWKIEDQINGSQRYFTSPASLETALRHFYERSQEMKKLAEKYDELVAKWEAEMRDKHSL